MKSVWEGPRGLTLAEWLVLLVLLLVLAYSAYQVKGEDLRDIRKFMGAEARALEVKRAGTPR
jgi:hypothetical protein